MEEDAQECCLRMVGRSYSCVARLSDSALLPESNNVCHQALTKGRADGEREQNQLLQMEGTEWTRAGVSLLGSNGRNMGSKALSTDPRILLVREVLSV